MNGLQVYAKDREEWRSWLSKNHASSKSVWLIYYKKPSGKPSVSYNEAVEEALCFGWIDSTVNKIDEERFKQLFTPRNPKSVWSLLNKKRALKMIQEKRMTSAGMNLIRAAKKSGMWAKAYTLKKTVVIPKDLTGALRKNPEASKNFSRFAPGYRNLYVLWINDAKGKDTRERRIRKVVERLELNKKPGVP